MPSVHRLGVVADQDRPGVRLYRDDRVEPVLQHVVAAHVLAVQHPVLAVAAGGHAESRHQLVIISATS